MDGWNSIPLYPKGLGSSSQTQGRNTKKLTQALHELIIVLLTLKLKFATESHSAGRELAAESSELKKKVGTEQSGVSAYKRSQGSAPKSPHSSDLPLIRRCLLFYDVGRTRRDRTPRLFTQEKPPAIPRPLSKMRVRTAAERGHSPLCSSHPPFIPALSPSSPHPSFASSFIHQALHCTVCSDPEERGMHLSQGAPRPIQTQSIYGQCVSSM